MKDSSTARPEQRYFGLVGQVSTTSPPPPHQPPHPSSLPRATRRARFLLRVLARSQFSRRRDPGSRARTHTDDDFVHQARVVQRDAA
jgi:hypothetical protein